MAGTTEKVSDFANVLEVCVDAGAKRVLISAISVTDRQVAPAELLIEVQPIFNSDPMDAVFNPLGAV